MKTLKLTEAEMDLLAETLGNTIRAAEIRLADSKRDGLPKSACQRHQQRIQAQGDILRKVQGAR